MASRIPGALAAITLIAVAASACSGASAPKPNSASVTIGKTHANLAVTTCNRTEEGLHVVAQSGETWTLDVRHDASAKSNILVVVQRRKGRTLSYQASANVVNPSGTPPTKISISAHGPSLHGSATVLRSVSSGARGATTAHASFSLSCGKVSSTT